MGTIQDEVERQYRVNQGGLVGAQADRRQSLNPPYKPPFCLTVQKPNNGFSIIREDGQQYVFTDPNRLLAYIREAIGLPMNEVSAADSGILVDDEMVEDK